MKFSINNGSSAIHTGYGHATLKMIWNIGKTDHSVLINRAAPVEITFAHPRDYIFLNPDSYKIGYTAWESTDIKDGWQEHIDQVDEMWVPNNFCKQVFSQYTDKEIHVFPHGIDSVFNPIKREVEDKVKFLHVGHPAIRKNLQDTVDTFLSLYAGRKDVELTIKAYNGNNFEINEPNINFISSNMSYANFVKLMGEHHALLYPSWGEGFGLIPLQALATGMPSIMTDGWCDYKNHCPELVINSELVDSPWQDLHPGKMFKPDLNDFSKLILHTEKNIESILEKQFLRAPKVHEEYSWERVVKEHFDSVEARLML